MTWPNGPPHRVAQDRVERRSQGQRQPEVVGREGECDRDHREHGPGVHAPVEDGRSDGKAVRGVGVRGVDAERRILEVLDRLRHAEEHQADADPGREQHGEPRPGGVVRPGVRTAQADAAEGRRQQQQAEEDEDVARGHEHPVERRGEPSVQCVEGAPGGVPEHEHPGDEGDDGEAGDDEDRVVNVEAEEPDVVLAELVVGLRGDGHAEPALLEMQWRIVPSLTTTCLTSPPHGTPGSVWRAAAPQRRRLPATARRRWLRGRDP